MVYYSNERKMIKREKEVLPVNQLTKHRAVSIASWALFAMIIAVWLLPAGYGFLVSVKNYRHEAGIGGSPWTGFSKYLSFWQSGDGSNAFSNSFFLSMWSFLGSLLLGSLAAWCIPRIRGRSLRFVALAVLLAPIFIPSACWVAGILPKIAQNPPSTRWRYILIEIIRNASVIGFAGAAFAIILPVRGFFHGLSWSVVLWVFLCLTPNFDMLHLLRSPIVSMDTMDAYAYRIGISQGDYSSGAMIQQLKSALQILLGAVVCTGVYIVFLRRRKAPIDSVVREQSPLSFAVWAVPVGLFALVMFILFAPTLYLHNYAVSLLQNLPMQLVSTALAFAVALVFSWGMLHALRTMGIVLFTVCAGLLLANSAPMVGNFLFFEWLGLTGTIFPGVLTALLNPTCILVILLCARLSLIGHLRAQSIWWIALLPACLAAARYWGDVLSPALYLGNQKWVPFGSLLHIQQANGYGSDALTYLVNLIPALLFVWPAVLGVLRYVDTEKAPVRSLLPEHKQFTQNVVYHDDKPVGDEVGKLSVPKPEPDGDVVEEQGEPQ